MSRSMRKRCIANAESRPPPRCLKSAPTQSPRHLDRTISTPRRVDQAIPFDPLDVKTKDSCQNDQKDSSVQIKHGQVITLSATVHDSSYKAVDRPHTEPAESKKVQLVCPQLFLNEIRFSHSERRYHRLEIDVGFCVSDRWLLCAALRT